ncbi:hypothetical protein CYMTET_48300 [Cymbomonas tetramitiformis]|uniref:1-phosphatidylinositol-4-phosphate 5-kinase n=1 Tax=Cymbomonas tetramitiformis TaxID=36881 RepID=A0AAE0BTL9_9CHLO|nr:hypothetical protein CYMTET_48300 [Cymbomonas tetramitiformis]
MTLDDLESSDYSGGVYFDELSVDAIRTIYFVGSLIGSLLCLFVVALHLYYRHKHARPAYHSSLVCYRAISNIFGFFSHIASFIYESPNEEEDGGSHCEYIGMFYHATLLMSNSWFFCMALDLLYQVNDPFKHLDNLRKRYHFFTWTTPLLLCPFLLNNDEYGPSQFGFCFIRRTENEMDRNHTLFQFFYIPLALAWSFSVYSLAFTLYVYRIGGFLSGSRTLYIQNMRYGLFGVVSNGILWTWLGFVWLAQFYEAGTVTVLPYMFSIGLGSQGVIDLVTYVYSTKHLRDAASSDIQHDPEFFHNMLREDIIRCIGWGIREATLQVAAETHYHRSSTFFSHELPRGQRVSEIGRGLRKWQTTTNLKTSFKQALGLSRKMSAPKPTMKEMDIDEERTWSDSECDSNKQSSTNGLFNCLPQSLPVPCALRNGRTSTLVVTPRAGRESLLPQSSFFKTYAPHGFSEVRRCSKLTNDEYLNSFTEAEGFDSPLIEKRLAGGASGSIFCLTWDNKFIVKTVTKEESKVLQSLLAPLVDYFRQYPRSLLTRFVGLHSLQMHPGSRPVHFVVMPNIFPRMDQELHEVYDIKGSWIKRGGAIRSVGPWSVINKYDGSLLEPQGPVQHHRKKTMLPTFSSAEHDSEANGGSADSNEDGSAPVSTRKVKVLKDLDLVFSLELPKNEQEEIVQQLQLDSAFLCAHYIMDYSLLLGVRYPEQWSPAALNARIFGGVLVGQPLAFGPAVAKMHKECSSDEDVSGGVETDEDINGPLVQYGIGIIDILQKYDMSKRLERFTKVLLLGKDPDGISAVHEREYQRRFSRRMEMVFGTRRMDKKSRRLREKLNQIPRPSAPIWHRAVSRMWGKAEPSMEGSRPLSSSVISETPMFKVSPGTGGIAMVEAKAKQKPKRKSRVTFKEAEDDSTAPARPSGRMSGITPTSVPPAQIPGFQVNQLYRRQEFGPLEFDCKKDTPQPAEGSNNDHAGAVSEAGQDLNLNGSALDIDSLSERLSTNGLPELGKRPSSKSKEVVVNPLFGQDEDSDDYEPAGEDEGVFSAAESVS